MCIFVDVCVILIVSGMDSKLDCVRGNIPAMTTFARWEQLQRVEMEKCGS